MASSPSSVIIVVAAGRGTRVGGDVPKQYLRLAGQSLLTHTLASLLETEAEVLVVIHPDDRELYRASINDLETKAAERLLPPVHGGASRQDSVRLGLKALASLPRPPEFVLIHDGARPFPSLSLVGRALAAAEQNGAAVPGLLVTDTIKQVDEAERIVATPQRAGLRAVQTPQAFRFDLIHAAHLAAETAGARELTDDAALAA